MTYPPIRPDRCLLWITLRPDATAKARYQALQAVLKQCRLHPMDTTACSQVVVVEEAALQAHLDAARATLGEGDMLHRVRIMQGRLQVTVIAPPEVMADSLVRRPPERLPPWLRGD